MNMREMMTVTTACDLAEALWRLSPKERYQGDDCEGGAGC